MAAAAFSKPLLALRNYLLAVDLMSDRCVTSLVGHIQPSTGFHRLAAWLRTAQIACDDEGVW